MCVSLSEGPELRAGGCEKTPENWLDKRGVSSLTVVLIVLVKLSFYL